MIGVIRVLRKILTGVGLVVLAAVVLFVVALTLSCVSDIEQYRRVYRTPLLAEATVARHEVDEDFAYSYIDYALNGVTYTDVLYESEDYSSDLTPIGREILVRVSPEDPSRTFEDLEESGYTLLLFGTILLLCVAGVWSWAVRARRSKDVVGMPDPSVLQRDVRLTICGRYFLAFWALLTAACLVMKWRYPMVFGNELLVFASAGAILFVICFLRAVYDTASLNEENFEVRRDVLERKELDRDPDGTTYFLHYRSGERLWKTLVSKKRFDAAREGDTVLAVYLRCKRRPVMHYDNQGIAR